MRLHLAFQGPGNLACTVAEATLRQRHMVAYDTDRIRQLAGDVLDILQRGNQTHKLTEANLEQLRLVGEELARRLLPGPVLTDIRRTMGNLTLELDEELVWIPWELIYDGEQFLCRRFDMGRIVRTSTPTRAMISRSRKPASRMKLLVMASNPAGDLPQVEREGSEIIAQLDEEGNLLARLVTEPDLGLVRREMKDHDMVHFAGHADRLEDRGQPGWRLSDGILPTSEIEDMGAGRPMPLLVFSNACHSGAFGDPTKGAFGLAHAFLTAGVRHYVGTQWEVIDGQGAQFARHFYKDLVRGGSMGAAVRNARNRVIAESGEGNLAWATYVLYGDPDFAPLPAKPKQAEPMPELPIRLGVRATAPYKGKKRRPSPSSGDMRAVQQNRSSQLLAGIAALSLLVTAVMAVLLVLRQTNHHTTHNVTPAAPTEAVLLTVESHTNENDRQAGDAAALLAACLSERIGKKVPLVQQAAPGQALAVVAIEPRRLQGKLLLTVTVTKEGQVVYSKIIPGDGGLLTACQPIALDALKYLK
ncbi:MAG: CHAT domain-containing protein [Deltaproteobacteria bacterium]|nr:CHAT domain-containing protein [Deltaproteobacteria bacterium]